MAKSKSIAPLARSEIAAHFADIPLEELAMTARIFSVASRVDINAALADALVGPLQPKKHFGIHVFFAFETVNLAEVINRNGENTVTVAPLQYEDVDIGELMPTRCLKSAIWLCCDHGMPFAILLSGVLKHGASVGVHVEIAVPRGAEGAGLVEQVFSQVQKRAGGATSYRGKVLSLEQEENRNGAISGIKVHRLKSVAREDVILPEKTLGLLDRNIHRFIKNREKLNELRLGLKKGLLFYGPPGTGKTHTIHYLASQMEKHTTLLITANQIGLLSEYMQLARFLQPAMVVMEDVDLIARSRTSSRNACEESLLNRLLNEMDGLQEDARVLFVLTTNYPEQLEAALTARPGRIDQAIEFPLPDADGREKLIRLYAGQLKFEPELLPFLVAKSAGGSGAFIKELMRRSTQFLLEDEGKILGEKHVEAALDEMLFSGGVLNAKLLGFAKT